MRPLRAGDPSVVGEFTLLGRLGAGGMGVVFLGVTRSGRPVAVKVIRPEIAADPVFRGRFVREVAAARQVGGFWTASVVAADADAVSPWLATEYVPGLSLGEAVAEAGTLPVAAVRVVAARLAEALAAIHAVGLVHRDLKPANVVLAPDGPKVIDFGIARAFLTDTAGMTALIGTPGYMSPEQIRGESLSPASDVFSLGGTLVYALRGSGPFHTGAPAGVIYRVVAEPADLTGVPPPLAGLVAACLAKDPRQRPTTAALLSELSPAAGAVVAPYGGWRPPHHDPAAALIAPPDPAAARIAPPDPEPATHPLQSPAAPAPSPGPPGPELGRVVARQLAAGERVVRQWRPPRRWLFLSLVAGAGATILLVLLGVLSVAYLHAIWFATIPFGLAVLVVGWTLVRAGQWRSARLVVTDQRVLVVRGVVLRRVDTLPLSALPPWADLGVVVGNMSDISAYVRHHKSKIGRG